MTSGTEFGCGEWDDGWDMFWMFQYDLEPIQQDCGTSDHLDSAWFDMHTWEV